MLHGMTSGKGTDTESSAERREQVLGQSGGEDLPFLRDESSFLSQRWLQRTSSWCAGAFDFGSVFFNALWCRHWRLGRGGHCGNFFIWKEWKARTKIGKCPGRTNMCASVLLVLSSDMEPVSFYHRFLQHAENTLTIVSVVGRQAG